MKAYLIAVLGLCTVLCAASVNAGALPTNYTVKAHSYLWNASGSSATQGSGSISGWPTVTSGTASCALSQVAIADAPAVSNATGVLPGSGTVIKADCVGGASGGTVNIEITVPTISQTSLGNFGYYFYQDPGGNAAMSGPSWYLALSGAYAKFFIFPSNATTAMQRRQPGWNMFTWRRGDASTTAGGYTHDENVARCRMSIPMVANAVQTVYFGDFLYGYYAKPQVSVWFADNPITGADYSIGFPYLQTRAIPGNYAPTTNYLPVPSGSQITNAQLREMAAAGWSISPHFTGTYLDYTLLTTEQLNTEIEAVLAYHAAQSFPWSNVFVYNGASSNATSNAALAAHGIPYALGANISTDKRGMQLYGGLINPYAIPRFNAGNDTVANTLLAIEHAVKYGEHIALLYHDLPDTVATVNDFKSVMDYVARLRDANIVDVTTFDGLVRRQSSARWNRMADKVN